MTVQKTYHFPRKNFAERLVSALSEFETPTTFSLMLFDGRRKGKTTFLIHDLTPVAKSTFSVFYFSFMQGKDNVEELFYKSLIDLLKSIAQKQKLEFEINLGLLKVKGTNEMAFPDSLTGVFQALDAYSDKPILFLFDEFQELGRSTKDNSGFIKTLRTILDQNRSKFKSIFAGSSFNDINQMFNNYSEPFYKFGIQISLPSLKDDFISFQVEKFKEYNGVTLDENKLKAIFEKNNRLPFVIIEIIKELEINGEETNYDIETAYASVKVKHMNLIKNNLYAKLNVLDKAILKWIVLRQAKISSKEALEFFSIECPEHKISKENVLTSANKLKKLNILSREKSQWKILNAEIYQITLDSFI